MIEVEIRGKKFTVEHDNAFWAGIEKWEPYSFEILNRFAADNVAMVDVGAYNGVLSLYASDIYAEVHAIEPDPVAYERLTNNIKYNDIKNVSCINAAAAKAAGEIDLYVINAGDSTSSMINRTMEKYKAHDVCRVKAIRLSEYLRDIKREIGLLKMDIEGGEVNVIPEISEYLSRVRPTLYLSFHPNWFPAKLTDTTLLLDILFSHYRAFNVNMFERDRTYVERALSGTEHSFVFVEK